MSKVINLHPRKYRLVQDIVSQFKVKSSGKAKIEQRSYTVKAGQPSGVVVQLIPIIKTGWDFFSSELEFE